MVSIAAIETTTVADKVRASLRDQIIQGELRPGDRVVQNLIAEQLGVSRIPVREAIHALISEGLLSMEPHHGAVVTPVSLDMANEVFGLRAVIEPRLLRLAADKIDESALLTARKQLVVMKRKSKKTKDFSAWAASHWAFHTALYEPSGQTLTLEIVRRLMQHSERFIALEIASMSSADADLADHEEILSLCEQGKFDAGADRLAEHILRTPQIMDDLADP